MESSNVRDAFHLTAGGDVRDPWSRLADLRRSVGVFEGGMFAGLTPDDGIARFAVLRYDDCNHVLRDDATFSSTVYVEMMGPVMGHTILEMDAPEHRRHRNLAGHAFRQKTLQRWEDELIGPLAHEMIDAFAARGRAELVKELTFPYPVQVIARLLGLPHEDYPHFQALAFTLTSVGAGYDAALAASRELADYLLPIVRARRADPRDDLISELATAEVDGEVLTDIEIVSYLRLLLPAGSETTYCSVGSLLLALLTHPDQLEDTRRSVARRPRHRGAAAVGARGAVHPAPRRPRFHRCRRRDPRGRACHGVPGRGQPRRDALRRPRPLRHPPRRPAAPRVLVRPAHVPRHAPGPNGDAHRAQRGARPLALHRARPRPAGHRHPRPPHPRVRVPVAHLCAGALHPRRLTVAAQAETGGLRCAHGCACSSCAATRNSTSSRA